MYLFHFFEATKSGASFASVSGAVLTSNSGAGTVCGAGGSASCVPSRELIESTGSGMFSPPNTSMSSTSGHHLLWW